MWWVYLKCCSSHTVCVLIPVCMRGRYRVRRRDEKGLYKLLIKWSINIEYKYWACVCTVCYLKGWLSELAILAIGSTCSIGSLVWHYAITLRLALSESCCMCIGTAVRCRPIVWFSSSPHPGSVVLMVVIKGLLSGCSLSLDPPLFLCCSSGFL